jgi:hypothetical protein
MKKVFEKLPARPFILGETMAFESSDRAARDVRKYQIERYRQQMPGAGYVAASLFEKDGRPRFQRWEWHGDTMLSLDSEHRSFYPGSTIDLWASHFGRTPLAGTLQWKFGKESGGLPCRVDVGETKLLTKIRCPDVSRPERFNLAVRFENAVNSWDLWIVPKLAVLPPITKVLNEQAYEYVSHGGNIILIASPVKGSWKCPEYDFRVTSLWQAKPNFMIEDLFMFDLLSGRTLQPAEGVEVLAAIDEKHPLLLETKVGSGRLMVSAFRHETPAGRWLLQEFSERRSFLSKFRDVQPSDSIVMEQWEMSLDGTSWTPVQADTPLANKGKNIFEGWATFRTNVEIPGTWTGRKVILRAEAVGDAFEIFLDGKKFAEVTRESRDFDFSATPGKHELRFRVQDRNAAGGMVGPVYLTTTPNSMVL